MLRKALLILLMTGITAAPCPAKTLVIAGRISSEMTVTQEITFGVDRNLSELTYRFPVPAGIQVPSFNQRLADLHVRYQPEPDSVEDETDAFGNSYKVVTWHQLSADAHATIVFTTALDALLDPIKANAPFPLVDPPAETAPYLQPTKQVQSTNPDIVARAADLSAGARTQSAAVDAILNFVADHIHYETPPKSYDALYGLTTGTGNCQNYAHLACALLRASGIPARVAVGLTLKDKWKIPLDNHGSSLVQGMGEGLHAWIEVWFPGLGWLPCDPQQTRKFTSTRHIKYAHGPECNGIGTSWRAAPVLPRYASVLSSTFARDTVKLTLKGSGADPRGYMASSQLIEATPEITAPPEPVPVPPPVVNVALPGPVTPSAKPRPKPADKKLTEQKLAQKRLAEKKLAERKLAEQRLAEKRLAEQRLAEQRLAEQRLAEQRLAEQKLAAQRLAEKRAAEQRLAERRLADQKLAEERMARLKLAEKQLAERALAEQKLAERRLAERRLAEQKLAELKQNELSLAEQRAAEKRLAAERLAEQKLAERKLAEQRLAEQKLAEERLAEQNLARQRLAEQRLADQRLAELKQQEQRLAEQRLAEQRLAEQRLVEQRLADQRLAEQKLAEQRLAELKLAEQKEQKLSEQKLAEQKLAEQRLAEQKQRKAAGPPRLVADSDGRLVFGNMRFPEMVSLYTTSGDRGEASLEQETAEYATSGSVYAQAFIIDRPLRLDKVSIAMKKFGGDGTVYLDIVADDHGKPGLTNGVRSQPIYLENVKRRPGYSWLDFALPADTEAFRQGKYWIVLRRSGEAIVNWFYTPGKPYGGPDDTRSTARGWQWEDILTYDFVFKVAGRELR